LLGIDRSNITHLAVEWPRVAREFGELWRAFSSTICDRDERFRAARRNPDDSAAHRATAKISDALVNAARVGSQSRQCESR
jgi:hypothetical protein